MKLSKDLEFDLYLSRVKAQTQERVFEVLAQETATICNMAPAVLFDIFRVRLAQRSFGMGEGVAIFDVRASSVSRPVLAVMTFDNKVDFNALDDKPVDVMAALISPQSSGPKHLQTLAGISRIMKSHDLQDALRCAKNVDEMRVLFMPSQDWMIAA